MDDGYKRLVDGLNELEEQFYQSRLKRFDDDNQAWKDHIQMCLDQGMEAHEAWASADAAGLRLSCCQPDPGARYSYV